MKTIHMAAVAAVLVSAIEPDAQLTTLRLMLRTVNAGDASGYARLYTPSAVITIHGTGELKGRTSIEEHEVELLRQFPGARLAFYDVWQTSGTAVVHYAVNGKAPSGQARAMGHEGLLFFRFDSSGAIEEEHRYSDSLTPMAQMGIVHTQARPIPVLPADLRAHTAVDSAAEKRNVSIARRMLAAIDARQEAAFLPLLADDATIDELMLPLPFVGREQARRWFATWTRAVPDLETDVTTILGIGDDVLLETEVRGTLKQTLGPLSPSDNPFSIHRGMIVRVRNAKVDRIVAFMNVKELAEETGQWPPRGDEAGASAAYASGGGFLPRFP